MKANGHIGKYVLIAGTETRRKFMGFENRFFCEHGFFKNRFLTPLQNIGFENRFLQKMGFRFLKPVFKKWVFNEI